MILIADGGSTKTSWCLINSQGVKNYFTTEGYNPFFVSKEYIVSSMCNSLPADLDGKAIKAINFYGAGVHSAEKVAILEGAFSEVFPNSTIEVAHDLLAAARALLGNETGFAAILGTGTNTGIYDGKEISMNIDSGGYILGDEGSGCHLGKKLLLDYLRTRLPENLQSSFFKTYQLTEDQVVDRIYSMPLASRFAASFSRFVNENIDEEYMQNLVKSSFREFFENLVSSYPNYKSYSFNCIGSVGYTYRGLLSAAAKEYGMTPGVIISSPMEGLVKYHTGI